MPTSEITLPELIEKFGSEDACHAALAEMRWPDGIACPRCGSKAISRIVKRRQFDCDGCRYQFSVRVGTIFQESKLPLWKWFLAVYMMVQSKKGVSAKQLQRMLGVTYKTAWFLCHRIREAMKVEGEHRLSGIVEADETFLGGKRRGVGSGNKDNKTVVLGAVERGGEVRLKMAPSRKSPEIRSFIKKNVSRDADALHTDSYKAYIGAARQHRIPHGRVDHSRYEWVNGQVHTNTIEGVFSLLDRSILGAYHKISTKHLPRYLDEVEWRYNNRENPYLFRDTILELIGAEQLEYKSLVRQS